MRHDPPAQGDDNGQEARTGQGSAQPEEAPGHQQLWVLVGRRRAMAVQLPVRGAG
jgi:hypothetical protein